MIRFSETKRNARGAVEAAFNEFLLLRRRSEIAEHQHGREVADNGAFILEIIVEAQTLMGEMLADHGHRQIAAVLTTELLRQAKTQMPRLIGELAHLAQQFFPVVTRQALIVPIGARMLATMIEETLVVVFGL